MGLVTYLSFNGNCEEAMNFYKDALNGTIDSIMHFGDSPMQVDEAHKNNVLHGIMTLDGSTLMCSDTDGKRKVNFGDNFSLSLNGSSEEDLLQKFDAISAGGNITMPLQDTFWGARFGMCTDKFGINWMFNYDKPKP